jgi:hypothetical protein
LLPIKETSKDVQRRRCRETMVDTNSK